MSTTGSASRTESNGLAGTFFVKHLVRRVLLIRPDETFRVTVLFLQLFATSGIFVLGRTVRDTLFLSRYSPSALPWMFVLYGIAAAALAFLYTRWADRAPRGVLLHLTAGIGAGSYLAVWAACRAGLTWVYPVFYVWAEILSNLLLLQFWTLESDLENPRDARRLNATIGAARPAGVICFGAGASSVVRAIGTEQLLFVLAGLAAVFSWCVHLLRNQPRVTLTKAVLGSSSGRAAKPTPQERSYLAVLGLLLLLMFTTLTLGDYQFKIVARSVHREDDLARFFSSFYAVVGILSALFQLFLTPRILSRFGAGTAMTVLPGVFGTSSIFLFLKPGLTAASVMKFADNGLQYTLHDTTMQSLYAAFPPSTRARTRGWVEGALKPLSYGAGGLLLVLLLSQQLDVRGITLVSVPLAVAWLATAPMVRRHYLSALERGLAGPVPTFAEDGTAVIGVAERRILLDALQSGDSQRALVALEQLQNRDVPGLRRALIMALDRSEPALRSAAIRALEALEHTAAVPHLRVAACDENPGVRAAAVGALSHFLANDHPGEVLPFLDDLNREVRIEAFNRLIRFGGLEASALAGLRLLAFCESNDPQRRREACHVLGELGRFAYGPLERLLHDRHPSVRRAALRAAGRTGDPRYMPTYVANLRDPALWTAALAGLVASGEAAIPAIAETLTLDDVPRAVRLELPRALASIPSRRSFDVLEQWTNNSDSHLRLRVYSAMGRLRESLGMRPRPEAEVIPRVRREIVEAGGNILAWHGASARFGTPLLSDEMKFRKRRAQRRILRILELRYARRELTVVLNALDEPGRRAEALEALDAIVSPPLRRWILPYLESQDDPEALRRCAGVEISVLAPEDFMLLQTRHPNPYVVLLALDSLSRADVRRAVPEATRAVDHRDPLVREAGLRALSRLDPALLSTMPRLLEDGDAVVARIARSLNRAPANRQAATSAEFSEATMYGTVEKILFLKSTPLFSGLTGEDLASLARVAEVCSFPAGATVLHQGDEGDYFYVVIHGSIAVVSGGRELERISTCGTLGELAVLDRQPHSDDFTALEPCELLRVGADEFFQVLREQPEIAESLLRLLAGEVRNAHKRLAETLAGQAPGTH